MTVNGHSKAAQSLAALSSEDRRWLLGQLSDDDRSLILKLLGGDPEQHDSVESALDNVSARHQNSDDYSIINAADADALVELMADEPDWIVAVLLTSSDWKWMHAFMDVCGAGRLARITEVIRTGVVSVKPKVRQVVTSAVAQRLRKQAPVQQKIPSLFERTLKLAERKAAEMASRTKGGAA